MGLKEQARKNIAAMPPRVIIFSFAGIILAGTFLLCLPISTRSGNFTPVLDALFTATSATCVTGLIIYDTYQHWSPFGQVVILSLIQVGGLGLLTFTTFFNLLIGRKVGLRGMRIASESVGSDTVAELPRLIRMVVLISLITEAAGAILLSTSFIPLYGLEGIAISIFLSISAFCNAGFDILGREGAFVSLTNYNDQPTVTLTIMALIVLGGLGFIVWRDLLEFLRTKRMHLHSCIVIVMSAILILGGAAGFLFLEWDNPDTLGSLSFGERLNAALFQSVTCRTAGFNSINIGAMREISKALSIILMFIGAAPGSTGGGIKVTALAVIIMTVISVIRGREDTVILNRKVSRNVVYKALAVTMLAGTVVAIATIIITATSHIDDVGITGIDVIFESVSAFATVGLSSGVTAVANIPSKCILILTMFIGRVGPVTFVLSLAMRSNNRRKEVIPDGKVYL